MGALRIADYLQLDADRAPWALLKLREPVSPISIAEWEKHRAVESIAWHNQDQAAVFIGVSPTQSQATHQGLRRLISGLQWELDHTSGVLSEAPYSSPALQGLRLLLSRVRTNLESPAIIDALPFDPTPALLRSDNRLFEHLIEELYGDDPYIAIREVVANAIDAVVNVPFAKMGTFRAR
jgi:molecular chaperone HtpG